jgi:MFS family permease
VPGTVRAVSVPASTTDDPVPQPRIEGQRGRRGVLRHRQFALLFAGQAASLLGDRLVMVAMPFAVLALPGGGPSGVGIVLGASSLGFALLVMVGGVIADRLPRQHTMLASDAVRGLVQGLSAYLLLSGHATVPRLAVLQLVYGGAEAFFRPAVLGLVPQVVEPGEEQPANALLALSMNIAMVIGPASAGVLVAWLGPGGAVAVDAATFVVSGLTLLVMRPQPYVPEPTAGFGKDVAAGFREVRSRSWLWSTLLTFTAYHAFVLPALFVLGPKVADDIRDGSTSWGLISTGFGLGAVAGSLLALRWRPRRTGLLIGGSLLVASWQAAIVTTAIPTWAVALLEAATGVAVSLTFTVWETALQERIPAAAQARVSAFDHLASVTLMPVGFALVGPVADAAGVRVTSLGATLVTAAVCLCVLPLQRTLVRPAR